MNFSSVVIDIGEMIMTRTLRGKVRGRTIELDEDPGEVDGQVVEIQIEVVGPDKPSQPPMS